MIVGVGVIDVVHPVDSLESKGTGEILDCVLHFHGLCLGVKDFVTKGLVILLRGGRDALRASIVLRGDHFCD
jgi:hypothetical protein